CLPERTRLRLESERSERPVVRTALGYPGTEQCRMCQEIGRHECTIRVTAHCDAVAITDAQRIYRVDRRLRAGHELLDVTVVRLLAVLRNDRHRWPIQNSITCREQQQLAIARQ